MKHSVLNPFIFSICAFHQFFFTTGAFLDPTETRIYWADIKNNFIAINNLEFFFLLYRFPYKSLTDIIEMMKTHPNVVLEILNRLYRRKSGSLFSKQGTNLKMIKAFQWLQEEIVKAYGEKLKIIDLMLVSSTG